MRTASEYLELNRTGKPDVGDKIICDDTINALRSQRRKIERDMAAITNALRHLEDVDTNEMLSKYETLNKKLYAAKVEEAKVVYLRNIL